MRGPTSRISPTWKFDESNNSASLPVGNFTILTRIPFAVAILDAGVLGKNAISFDFSKIGVNRC